MTSNCPAKWMPPSDAAAWFGAAAAPEETVFDTMAIAKKLMAWLFGRKSLDELSYRPARVGVSCAVEVSQVPVVTAQHIASRGSVHSAAIS